MNADRAFIDTNIFVYAKLKSNEDDQRTRAAALFLQGIEADVIHHPKPENSITDFDSPWKEDCPGTGYRQRIP